MPNDDCNLAGDSNRSHVRSTPTAHSFVERPKRPGPSNSLPRGFDQHRARMTRTLLGDATVPRQTVAGLMYAWVQAQERDQAFRISKPINRTDCGEQADRYHHVDAGDRHEPFRLYARQGVARELAFQDPQVVGQSIILAQVPLDCVVLINR